MSAPIRLITNEQKLNFLLAIIPYLDENQDVTIRDVATKFGVVLEDAMIVINKIPLFGFPSDNRTMTDDASTVFDTSNATELEADHIIQLWAPSDAITLKPKLSSGQAAALLMGLQQLHHIAQDTISADKISQLANKIASGVSGTLSNTPVIVAEPNVVGWSTISAALTEGRPVTFGYVNAAGVTSQRLVSPAIVRNIAQDWLIAGYDHDHQEERIFRLDRISHIKHSDTAECDPAILTAIRNNPEYGSGNFFHDRGELLEVLVTVHPDAFELLRGYHPKKVPNQQSYSIRVNHFHNIKRLISSAGGAINVISPPEAVQAVREWLESALKRYQS